MNIEIPINVQLLVYHLVLSAPSIEGEYYE
jgi:hypothetical protein